jgi:hypothetical protein
MKETENELLLDYARKRAGVVQGTTSFVEYVKARADARQGSANRTMAFFLTLAAQRLHPIEAINGDGWTTEIPRRGE